MLIFLLTFGFLNPSPSTWAKSPNKRPSLFSLSGKWQDQNGRAASLQDFSGEVTVLSMVYTSCDYSCPLITRKMKQIHKAFRKPAAKNARFLLVTFDPERDTVKKLKEYSKAQNLDEGSFSLLTADTTITHSLAIAMGFQYKKMPNGHFSHGNLITILDKDGTIALQQDIGTKIEPLVEFVDSLARK